MATTTNYSWTTPDDTGLVKDGASAIRTLGTAIDTTTKNLNPSTTLGDIEYRSSSANTNTRLGIGSTGQVLSVSGGVPVWSTISTGGMTLISNTVASSNSSISLSSIPQTYKQLLLIWSGVSHAASGSTFGLRLNNSSSSIYNTAGQSGLNANSDTTGQVTTQIAGWSSGIFLPAFGDSNVESVIYRQSMGCVLIDNYTDATLVKTCNVSYAYYNSSAGQSNATNTRSVVNLGAAVTSIDIVRLSGSSTISNTTNTSIRLYGLS